MTSTHRPSVLSAARVEQLPENIIFHVFHCAYVDDIRLINWREIEFIFQRERQLQERERVVFQILDEQCTVIRLTPWIRRQLHYQASNTYPYFFVRGDRHKTRLAKSYRGRKKRWLHVNRGRRTGRDRGAPDR